MPAMLSKTSLPVTKVSGKQDVRRAFIVEVYKWKMDYLVTYLHWITTEFSMPYIGAK
jgi:hypothetical protein